MINLGGDAKRRQLDIQRNYAFKIRFPYLMSTPDVKNTIESLCSKVTLPGIEKKHKSYRFFGVELTQTMGTTFNHEMNITFVFDKHHVIYNALLQWFEIHDLLAFPKLNPSQMMICYIDLYDMDCKTVLSTIQVNDIYPIRIPDINLDSFSDGDLISLDCTFGYSDISYGQFDLKKLANIDTSYYLKANYEEAGKNLLNDLVRYAKSMASAGLF